MYLCAGFIIALTSQEVPLRPARPVVQTEVVVLGSRMQLPPLPEGMKNARGDYKAIKPQIKSAMQELERGLVELYAAAKDHALHGAMKVPRSHADEARTLVALIQDRQSAELGKAVLNAWDAWQSFLTGTADIAMDEADADPQNVQPSAEGAKQSMEAKEDKELRMRLRGMRKSAILRRIEAEELRRNMPEFTNAQSIEWALQSKAEFDERILVARRRTLIADKKAPSLARAWAPFVDHLNASATQLADTESGALPTQNEAILGLRLQARILLLERFRSAFWFSQVVWSTVVSDDPPAPLRPLAPMQPPGPG